MSAWPGSRGYMLGNVFKGEDGAGGETRSRSGRSPLSKHPSNRAQRVWNFRQALRLVWPFCRRAVCTPLPAVQAKRERAQCGCRNAGCYTVPIAAFVLVRLETSAPAAHQGDLISWTDKNLIILRGTADVNSDHNCETTGANAQGKNRYERAAYMIENGRAVNAHTRLGTDSMSRAPES